MTKRNTIQRQLVIAAVRFLADHPTAEEVYDRITCLLYTSLPVSFAV